MKLCMVNGYFHPFIGGSEKHMFELGRRLAKTETFHVVTSRLDNTEAYEELQGMKIHRLETKHKKMPVIYPPPLPVTKNVDKFLAELDKEHDFEVFNLHGRWFPRWNKVVNYANKKGKMMVLTLHNQRPLGISPIVTLVGTAYDGVIGKGVLRNCDHIISVSAAAKVDIMNYGLDADKIEVIHNGVDTSFYKPSEPTFREEYLNGGDNLLMFVGRIIEQKGLSYFYDAIPEVLKEHPKTRVAIIGKGKLKELHMEYVKKKGLDKQIFFPGFIPEERMPELYSSADLFVLPSLWEVFPIAMLEALASGAPLLASDAGGNPEMVEENGNGRIVHKANTKELADAINSMLSDPAKLKEMGKKSREVAVNQFDWDIITRKTLDFYGKAIPEFYSGK